MKLIIGLGNPGKEYAKNRHNVGFMAIDHLVQQLPEQGLKWRQRVGAAVLETSLANEKVLLAKPQKFINQSGPVIADLCRYYNLAANDLLVIADDLQLPFGAIRTRLSGSDGGHNGLKSLIGALKTDEIKRIKIGIRNSDFTDQADWANFVLANFKSEEKKKLAVILDQVVENMLEWLRNNKFKEETLNLIQIKDGNKTRKNK